MSRRRQEPKRSSQKNSGAQTTVTTAVTLQQHINELLTEASDRFDPPGIGREREPHG